jgi:hypothetical protein
MRAELGNLSLTQLPKSSSNFRGLCSPAVPTRKPLAFSIDSAIFPPTKSSLPVKHPEDGCMMVICDEFSVSIRLSPFF